MKIHTGVCRRAVGSAVVACARCVCAFVGRDGCEGWLRFVCLCEPCIPCVSVPAPPGVLSFLYRKVLVCDVTVFVCLCVNFKTGRHRTAARSV